MYDLFRSVISRSAIGALCLAAVFAIACGDGGGSEGAYVTATKTEETAPPEAAPGVADLPEPELEPAPLEASPVEERVVQTAVAEISIEEYHNLVSNRRGRPLFVNFWATFCEPCKRKMPDIVDLYEEYGQDRVDFLAVSADYFSNTVEEVPAVMRELGMTLPTRILVTRNINDAITSIDEDWSGVLPATFIYDSEGVLMEKIFEEKTKEEIEEFILAVLGE